MSERISVTITAQDGASKTFTAIASSATKMGDAVEKAGTEGTQGLQKIDAQAKTTGSSIDQLKARATALGAVFGTLVSATSLLGASYRDQERQIDGINRTYGEQADAILEVTERIQDQTRFSNDAAREGALLATALVDAYGLSADQVGLLIERSADLAQIYGVSLPDAIQRTAGAIRGEGEAAERLGLNMSDAAIAARALQDGITNWNVPGALSEAEKAAYRFQILMEDTEQSVGAASDAAQTAGGGFRQFLNDVQDAGQSIGGFLGPVGQVAAELAPIAIALPVVSAGLGNLGTAFAGSAVGARALTLALGPVGGSLAVLTVALGAGVAAWLIYQKATKSAADDLSGFADAAEEARLAGDVVSAENWEKAAAAVTDFQTRINDLKNEIQEGLGGNAIANINFPSNVDDLWNQMTESIARNLSDQRIDQTAYLEWLQQQWDFTLAILENDQLRAANPKVIEETMNRINNVDMSQFRIQTEKLVFQLQALESAAVSAGDAVKSGFSDKVQALNEATTDWLSNGDNILRFWLELTEGANQGAAAFDGTAAELEAFQAQMDAAADFRALVQLAEDADNAAEALDAVLRTFQQIDELGQRSATAGSIAESIIGTEDQIGIAQQLLDAGRISLMEYQGALSAGTAIQESNLRVQEDLNAMRVAQLPLLASEQLAYEAMIDQISQLGPLEQRRALALMDSNVQAQIASQYATAYSASLGEIPTEVATNMIVSAAEADPVLKDLLLQFGLIEEGADGTITVNFPDGPTVQESVMALTESIDALTLAMGGIPPLHIEADTQQALAEALGVKQAVDDLDGTTATVYADASVNSANGKINDVEANLNDLDGSIGTVIANATDNASGKLGGVMALIRALDGLTATTYVDTVHRSRTIGGDTPFAMGGLVGYAAGGLIPFRGGEAGPEMLHLANGGQVPLMTDSIYAAPANSYVAPHNANTNYSQGGDTFVFNIAPGNDVDGIRRFMRDEFLPSFKGEMDRHKVAVTGGAQ